MRLDTFKVAVWIAALAFCIVFWAVVALSLLEVIH